MIFQTLAATIIVQSVLKFSLERGVFAALSSTLHAPAL